MIGVCPTTTTATSPSRRTVTAPALSVVKARCSASLASRARSSGVLLPRGTTSVNTGASAKCTTAEMAAEELGAADTDALGVGGDVAAEGTAEPLSTGSALTGSGGGGGSGSASADTDSDAA